MKHQNIVSSSGKKAIVSDLTAAGILGVLNTSFLVSFATLIFGKTCPDFFGIYVALLLLAGCSIGIMTSMLSSYPGTIGVVQDVPVAISGVIAVSFSRLLVAGTPEALFATLFTVIGLTTLLSGICFLLLGYFKLGNLVRFIPYPVLGGFLAATGWLLFNGGIQVATGVTLQLSNISAFIGQVDPLPLALGLGFSISLLILTQLFPRNMLVTPLFIVSSALLFLFIAQIIGFSIDQLKTEGWLLGPLPEGALWKAAAFPNFSLVHWSLIFSHIGSIATIVVLSALSFLLNSSGIEIIAGRDLDMNKDLKATGITNLVASIIGAPVCYATVSETALATRIGATRKRAGILYGLFLLAVFFGGGTFLSFFPNFVAGGLLLYLGISMLKEWLVDSWKSLPVFDYSIIVGIVVTVEFFGFLQGVAIGIVASVAIFVSRYSVINIVKNMLDGSDVRSSKDRSIADQRLLDYTADQLVILQLQGFIFFGTGNSLYEKIKKLAASSQKSLRFVVLDLGLVQGIDSSAVKSFEKLTQHLGKMNIDLVLVNMSERLHILFEANGFSSDNYSHLYEYDSLDHAIEKCEDQIITDEAKNRGAVAKTDLMEAVYSDMMAALEIQILFESITEQMKPYLEANEVSEGKQLYSEKELSTDIYFIIRGRVTLSRKDRDGRSTRIRVLGPWTITGELGAFLGYRSPYTAEVTKNGAIYKLSAEHREMMMKENHALAAEFQQLVIVMLGSQLMKTSRIVNNPAN
ncbi:MAG: SulP family inorganic anion transporter [Pseudomonadota bacterium]